VFAILLGIINVAPVTDIGDETPMGMGAVSDLDGWQAYCDDCKAFRDVRQEQDNDSREEYFEFVCNVCHHIVLTLQRKQRGTIGEQPPTLPVWLHEHIPAFLTFEQASQYIGLSQAYLQRECDNGRLVWIASAGAHGGNVILKSSLDRLGSSPFWHAASAGT
jgi:hypothetical protein